MIKRAEKKDIKDFKLIFEQTIRNINTKDYSDLEINAWVEKGLSENRFENNFKENDFYKYVIDNSIVGYISINNLGYIHSLYVHHKFQKKGIAKALLDTVTNLAKTKQIKTLSSDVSITALPFFKKNKFLILKEQNNSINEQILINYKVSKNLK